MHPRWMVTLSEVSSLPDNIRYVFRKPRRIEIALHDMRRVLKMVGCPSKGYTNLCATKFTNITLMCIFQKNKLCVKIFFVGFIFSR